MATRKSGGTEETQGGKAGGSRASATKRAASAKGAQPAAGDVGAKAKTGRASKPAAGAKSTGPSAGAGAAGGDMRSQLRDFAGTHRQGWGHQEWSGLLDRLRDSGHDVSDTDAVGLGLERERLALLLEEIPGVGPQRVRSIVDSFARLWDLQQASVEEIAERANVPRSLAEKVKGALH
jgi:hypothetical protein